MIPSLRSPWSRGKIAKLRKYALRTGAWLKNLSPLERCLVNAAINVLRRLGSGLVKSRELAKLLDRIAEKIGFQLQGFLEKIAPLGSKKAVQYVALALKWGHKRAIEWLRDPHYIEYLGRSMTYPRWLTQLAIAQPSP